MPEWLSGSEVKVSACNAGDLGLIPGSGRSPGEGNGNPLQYSCLENPMDGWALVGYSSWSRKESDMTEQLHFHFHFIPEWPSGFPYFLQLKSQFCNKEFINWATVSSCLVFADYIELLHLRPQRIFSIQRILNIQYSKSDFSIDHLVMSTCRIVSCVVGRGYLLWPVSSLSKTLLAFALLHFFTSRLK